MLLKLFYLHYVYFTDVGAAVIVVIAAAAAAAVINHDR